TIGFMRALPHQLLRSFRSTLSEAVQADLRLVVVDASDSDWKQQLLASRSVLDDLNTSRENERLVFNKVDRLDAVMRTALQQSHPDALFVSAHNPADMVYLRAEIRRFFERRYVQIEVIVGFEEGRLLARLHAETLVQKTSTTKEGLKVQLR